MIRLGDRPARPDPLWITCMWICAACVLIALAENLATEVFLWGLR